MQKSTTIQWTKRARPARSVAVLALLTILVVALFCTFLLWSLRLRELRHAELETVSLTRMLVEQTSVQLESTDRALQAVIERLDNPFGRDLRQDSPVVHLLLANKAAGQRHLGALVLVDPTGHRVNSSADIVGPALDVSDRDYFRYFADQPPPAKPANQIKPANQTMPGEQVNLADPHLYVGRPLRSRLNGEWNITLARALRYPNGSLRGVVVAAILLPELEQSYVLAQMDYVRPISLYLADGTLVASMPRRNNLIGDIAPELQGETLPIPGAAVHGMVHHGSDGERILLGIGRLPGFPLLLSVADDEQQSLASWREVAIPIGLGAVLIMIFTTLLAFHLIGRLRHREALAHALDAADARYQHTVQSVMDAIVAVDDEMRIVLFNPSAERMFGYAAEAVMGRHLNLLIPQRLVPAHEKHLQRFAHQAFEPRAMGPQLEISGLRSDGHEFPIESTISHSMIGGAMQFTAVLRDATDRRRAEHELRMMNTQLRQLSVSLQLVREDERKRISSELHDDLGQQMTGLKLSLSWLRGRVHDGKLIEEAQIDEMREQLNVAISSVRRIAAELRPRLLDDREFGAALTWQTQEFMKHSGLQCTLDFAAASAVTDEATATALFRIVQEALNNVVRHAHASRVDLRMVKDSDALHLTISDNGRGFDTAAGSGGIGLVSMRERCHAVGAEFSLSSAPGEGTILTVRLPLKPDAAPGTAPETDALL